MSKARFDLNIQTTKEKFSVNTSVKLFGFFHFPLQDSGWDAGRGGNGYVNGTQDDRMNGFGNRGTGRTDKGKYGLNKYTLFFFSVYCTATFRTVLELSMSL